MQSGSRLKKLEVMGKMLISRHGSRGSKRSANAAEKAVETKTRQQSKKLCREDG